MNKLLATTRGHKTLGSQWFFELWFSHQSSLYLDSEVTPKSPTILYRKPLGATHKKKDGQERLLFI